MKMVVGSLMALAGFTMYRWEQHVQAQLLLQSAFVHHRSLRCSQLSSRHLWYNTCSNLRVPTTATQPALPVPHPPHHPAQLR